MALRARRRPLRPRKGGARGWKRLRVLWGLFLGGHSGWGGFGSKAGGPFASRWHHGLRDPQIGVAWGFGVLLGALGCADGVFGGETPLLESVLFFISRGSEASGRLVIPDRAAL